MEIEIEKEKDKEKDKEIEIEIGKNRDMIIEMVIEKEISTLKDLDQM